MTHFMSYHKTNDVMNIANPFFRDVVWLHGVLRSIMYNQDSFLS
jgi:hypothetical protein